MAKPSASEVNQMEVNISKCFKCHLKQAVDLFKTWARGGGPEKHA